MSDSSTTGAKTANIQSIKKWLSTCNVSHASTCIQPFLGSEFYAQRPTRPCRLIDAENQCIVQGDVEGDYLALSYTWQRDVSETADEHQLLLLRDNEDSLMVTNALKEHATLIPKVIRDAIDLTSAIGQKYLWVDRLCIVQDDPQKKSEVGYMDQIYYSAYMTIVAAASRGLDCTPKETYTPDEAYRSPEFQDSDEELTFWTETAGSHYALLSESRWATRAWTYQEYILSKRIVFFLDNRIFWQCESATWDMNHLRPNQDRTHNTLVPGMSTLVKPHRIPTSPEFSVYADLICPYNGRELTKKEDGLSACMGILSCLTPQFPGGFLFGMPLFYLDYALLWQPLKACYTDRDWPPHGLLVQPDGCDGRTGPSTRRPTLPSWAWCGWQCYIDPWSFQPALNIGPDGRNQTDTTNSWKLWKTVEWRQGTSTQDPAELDRSPPSNYISALVTAAFFYPSATLEVRHALLKRPLCGAFWSAFANPVLTEKPLNEMPKVIVLRDRERKFAGLLRLTGDAKCKPNEEMELIAISRGSAKGKDFNKCFEQKVFRKSRYYDDGRRFHAIYDDNGWWIDSLEQRSYEGNYSVVASGEYETDLEVPKDGYEIDKEYQFYNVLWVQRGDDNIAYRAGCGRVFKDCWEGNNPVETMITLG